MFFCGSLNIDKKENYVILHKLRSMTEKEDASIKREELCQLSGFSASLTRLSS